MPKSPDPVPQPLLNAVDIARLAGVGRAAVSNWRRRHADFPKPTGGTEASPAFSAAEVEAWLRAQGKIAELPLGERVRRQLEQLRNPAASPAAPLVPALALLLLLHREPDRWAALAGRRDQELATDLPSALVDLASRTLGSRGARLLRLPALYGSTQIELARLLAELSAQQGPRAAAAALSVGPAEPAPRRSTVAPGEVTALISRLARTDDPATVYDPACGGGALLLATPAAARYGQEADPDLAAVALLRLALAAPTGAETLPLPVPEPLPLPLHLAGGDALRADAHPALLADAVLSRPPYNERGWGAGELAYDPRWEYGLPARADSELAWVQHCLARVRPGGLVVLLLPGAVAARRSGRRVRGDLLRRGALRALIALPTGAAAPYGVPLHLWVLRRPPAGQAAPGQMLLVDAAVTGGEIGRTVLAAWSGFEAAGAGKPSELAEVPGVYRAVPVVDLLDDETDLTPARHLPQRPADAHGDLSALQRELAEQFGSLVPLGRALPGYRPGGGGGGHRPLSTVGELLRGGGLELLPDGDPAHPGDVVLPGPAAAGSAARVHEGPPVRPARGARVLRPDPELLDPWFLAGFLTAAARADALAGGGSTLSRRDVKRVRVPRLTLAEQQRYARPFRQLALFEQRLGAAAELGERLAQGIAAGLAEGSLAPDE
jgi:predicted DNA-binding transcriptional regulator AlpA